MFGALLSLLLHGQANAPPKSVFESGVEVVNLTMTVQNVSSGQYINDIKQEDVEIFEDGVKQQVSFFSAEQLPISVVIIIDSSFSMQPKIDTTKSAAINFIRHIRPQDEAQIVQFSHRVWIAQEFTSDQQQLTKAINGLGVNGTTSLYNALYIVIKELRQRKLNERHRRAIVLLTDGDDTSSLISDERVLQLAHQSEINIFAIAIESIAPRDLTSTNVKHGQSFLTNLCEDSGGQLFRINHLRELNGKYELIAKQLSVQYSIGYVSSNPTRGSTRKISVTIPKRSDVNLRYRNKYYVPKNRLR